MPFDNAPPIFTFVFVLVILCFAGFVIYSIARWFHNKSQPLLQVNAKVVDKRDEVRMRRTSTTMPSRSIPYYYVTFEFEHGQRREFCVKGNEYGLLVVGDEGILSYQGDWFKGFQRV